MRSKTAAVAREDVIEGLGKGLRIIEAFDDDHPLLGASEAAALTGITRTAARRQLLSLVHFGYAHTDGRHFWLAPRVLRLGQSYLGASRLPRIVQPFIQRISMACGETVNVSVLDGHEVVYVARSSPPRWMSVGYQVGVRVPAHGVTAGVVMVAALPDTVVDEWIAAHDFASFTDLTVTDPERFRAELHEARTLGHWVTSGQLDAGFWGLSLALVDRKGACRGALGMTVPLTRYGEQRIADTLLPALREAAQDLRPLI